MKLLRSLLATALAAAFIGNASASAQEPPALGGVRDRQIRRPTISPYLNLLRRPGDTGTGGFGGIGQQYFGTVRPELQFRSAISRQFRSLNRLQRQVDEQGTLIRSQNSQLGSTGHQVRFLDLGGYFGAGAR